LRETKGRFLDRPSKNQKREEKSIKPKKTNIKSRGGGEGGGGGKGPKNFWGGRGKKGGGQSKKMKKSGGSKSGTQGMGGQTKKEQVGLLGAAVPEVKERGLGNGKKGKEK